MDRYFVTYMSEKIVGVTIAKEKPIYKNKDTIEVSIEEFKKITKELGSEYKTPIESNTDEIKTIREENALLIKDNAINQLMIEMLQIENERKTILLDILKTDFGDMLKTMAEMQKL